MKTIQKLTLGLLTVVATATSGFSSGTLVLDVVTLGESADVTGALTAATVQKIGNGIANVSGAVSAALQLSDGQFNVSGASSMPSAVTFDTNADNILKINDATRALPALTMSASGKVLLNVASLAWNTAPTGAATLTVDGLTSMRNLVIGADMSASPVAIIVDTLGNLQVGGAGKSTDGVHTINGMLEILASPLPDCIPGITTIQSAGVLKVVDGVTVPASDDAGDLFGIDADGSDTLKFNSGAVLRLGNGVTWARAITVGSAL
jgi:hypothetical protein